ncbi:hypothetical protein ACIU1J_19535 [Azospirillum doebereinerae]|uniref:hypothetical protein n=1 Tax=Azospirillum doebereinerae TaxID=92933 RepID=UPI001EE62FB9|nr:hypothetical protein [Azospirillum doebereinerae]MCG5241885.1 hypothetical protein [Azospirillum doebereinerae]
MTKATAASVPVLRLANDASADGGVLDARRPMDVEDLAVWAIRDQKADRTGGALFEMEAALDRPDREPRGSSRDGIAELMRRRETGGCRVDGGGPMRGVQPRVHPDAEAVVDAIRAIPDWRQRGLVFEYAQLGDRPDWSSGVQTLVPVPVPETQRGAVRHMIVAEWETQPLRSELLRDLHARGHRILDPYGRHRFPAAEDGFSYRTLDDGRRQVAVRWCPVEPSPSDAWIANTNALYAAWHAGMVALERALRRVVLRDHRCIGFDAPAEPWG